MCVCARARARARFCVYWCVRAVAYPNALHRNYAAWLSAVMGQAISEDMVADAMERLSITRKHIRKIAVEQDPFRCVLSVRIRLYSVLIVVVLVGTLSSLRAHHRSAFLGVPLEALCDVDESFAFLADCDRQHGYAFVGHEATILSNYVKGTKWTIMLAVGYTGLVNYWIHRENTTGEVRNAFLCCPLLGCVLLSACCSALSHLSIWLV